MTTLVGNLVADPELRFTPNGNALATFRMAVNNRVKQGDTWVNEEPEFHDVVVWRALGEHVNDTLSKGMRVIVVGDFKERSWETEEGERKTKRELIARDVGPSLLWRTARVER